jgi:hypothetical protein
VSRALTLAHIQGTGLVLDPAKFLCFVVQRS